MSSAENVPQSPTPTTRFATIALALTGAVSLLQDLTAKLDALVEALKALGCG
ncbi:hypothetical protein GXB85_13565 [Cellulomonas sp. APG4]|uniref:hypothetical protein n=1 Tax=Cellulomonas sp. APG4 TaxID=1538656 RepID=UPI00137A4B95|nr:hypothetical protein [Cellulomonas sp. APG4]NCT91970.1 hypothetical protein [Cellulomonas sp. APG4]